MDLWSLIVVGAVLVLLYTLFNDHRQRMREEGHGLPLIGSLLNLLVPVLDEVSDPTAGRRGAKVKGTKEGDVSSVVPDLRLPSTVQPPSRPSKSISEKNLRTLEPPKEEKKPTEEELNTAAALVSAPTTNSTGASTTASTGTSTAVSTDSTATTSESSGPEELRKKSRSRRHRKSKRSRREKKSSRKREKAKEGSVEKKSPGAKGESSSGSSSSDASDGAADEQDGKKRPRDSFEVNPNAPLKKRDGKRTKTRTTDDKKKRKKSKKRSKRRRSKRASKRSARLVPVAPRTGVSLSPQKKTPASRTAEKAKVKKIAPINSGS